MEHPSITCGERIVIHSDSKDQQNGYLYIFVSRKKRAKTVKIGLQLKPLENRQLEILPK